MEIFEISERTIADEPPAVRLGVGAINGLLNGGLIAGSVTLIYGREGVGKTTLALGMAHAAAESASVLYTVAEDEMDRRGVLHLAGRTGVTHTLRGATVESADDVIAAATQTEARLVVVDSLPAVTAPGSPQAATLRQLGKYARHNDVAVIALVMLDTTNRPAGGYRLLYAADTIIECSALRPKPVVRLTITRGQDPMLPFESADDIDDERTVEPHEDPDDTSLRRIKVSKSRGGPSVSQVMRMTSAGLEPHTGHVDAAIAEALTFDASAEDMDHEHGDIQDQQ
ncbi:AAA family ATPase [Mycolicibacterium septicum]|nr:AAA family ATPase [Mycolicibacterium septicum]